MFKSAMVNNTVNNSTVDSVVTRGDTIPCSPAGTATAVPALDLVELAVVTGCGWELLACLTHLHRLGLRFINPYRRGSGLIKDNSELLSIYEARNKAPPVPL